MTAVQPPLVNELLTQKAFKWTPGGCYSQYIKMKSSIIEDGNLQDVFRWINKHKKNIAEGKKLNDTNTMSAKDIFVSIKQLA